MRPRGSVSRPALCRSRCSVWPCLPAEYITVSAGICLPLASVVTVPAAPTSTAVTSSPNRNVTARSRRWNFSASMISGSQKSSMLSRFSTTVTLVPSAANIEAYSMPITPAPTTTIVVGQRLQVEDAVGVEHAVVVELDAGRAGRLGAGGDHDVFTADRCALAAGGFLDQHGVRVDEAAVALDEVDAVAHELRPDDVLLLADHVAGAREQVGGGDLLLDAVARAVQLALAHAGEVDDGLAQRLRRDGPGVHADPAEHAAAFDDRHRLAELCRRDRGLLAARTRADDDEVVLQHGTHGKRSTPVTRISHADRQSTAREINRPFGNSRHHVRA